MILIQIVVSFISTSLIIVIFSILETGAEYQRNLHTFNTQLELIVFDVIRCADDAAPIQLRQPIFQSQIPLQSFGLNSILILGWLLRAWDGYKPNTVEKINLLAHLQKVLHLRMKINHFWKLVHQNYLVQLKHLIRGAHFVQRMNGC